MANNKCNKLWGLSRQPKSAEIIQSVTGRSLPRPVPTRWNSLYDSLKALLGVKEKMPALMASLQLPDNLNESDFSHIQEYLNCLEPIAVALGLLQSVSDHFKDIFNIRTTAGQKCAIATLSMPLFKRWLLRHIPTEESLYLRIRFKQLIRDRQSTPEEAQELPAPMETDDFFNLADDFPGTSSAAPVDSSDRILGEYLNDADPELSMLDRHPIISAIFREYNTQPPSSAQAERLFSYATMVNAPKSNRLSDEKFEQRVILRHFNCLSN
ncbi:uncharacterized protein LOC108864412 [Galendromus occidentalis]|uniref:Uncharacterized protein LOC108864412 n=1 Tax=Galendromus occidentalis TaxID=34638 RepID=A0AAJ7SFB1_9ACAR|nr:uncharacterized protein LOC108864412 [Galendromus occidentalis]